MKRFCIDVEPIKSTDIAGWSEDYLAKRTICVPYRDGLEGILDVQKVYGAAELMNAARPIFYDESVRLQKQSNTFNGKISEPAKYKVDTRIVEESILESTPENKGKRSSCDFYGLLKKSRDLGMIPK